MHDTRLYGAIDLHSNNGVVSVLDANNERIRLAEEGAAEQWQCDVHGCPLVLGEADIAYGLIEPLPEEIEAERTLFPNANS